MKKKVIGLLISVICAFLFSGCLNPVKGDMQEPERTEKVKFEMFLNTGSCFVYTFEDPKTGVWYISTQEGVTPRLNSDGSLYLTKGEAIEEN